MACWKGTRPELRCYPLFADCYPLTTQGRLVVADQVCQEWHDELSLGFSARREATSGKRVAA